MSVILIILILICVIALHSTVILLNVILMRVVEPTENLQPKSQVDENLT